MHPRNKKGKSSVIVCVSFTHTICHMNPFLLTKHEQGLSDVRKPWEASLRCMAKNRSRDSLVGECERSRRVLISFHYCGALCRALLLLVFGSSCRVINGSGQTGAGKRPARWRKDGDRLLDGVRSNWLKWLSALRYWCVSPVHGWRGRPWWGVTVAFTGHHLKDQERLGKVDRMHEQTLFVRFLCYILTTVFLQGQTLDRCVCFLFAFLF